jgi:hypothetical protein
VFDPNFKEQSMEKPELLKKLDTMLDSAARERTWGSIEIEIRDGVPVVLRKASTEKLQEDATATKNRGRHEYQKQ